MKSFLLFPTLFTFILAANGQQPKPSPTLKVELEEVAAFPDRQLTGVAAADGGRVFVNFPYWSEEHRISVVEIQADGKERPYPSAAWNRKEGPPQKRFVCVQSVVADDAGMLWILDPAAPFMKEVVKGGPKLLQVDLKTDKVVRVYSFDDDVAPPRSYLNDVRVDTAKNHAFITDSGLGALLTLDLKTGKARRLLVNHASTKAEKGIELLVDGIAVKDPETGDTPAIHADGIALDRIGGWLYYHALTGKTLYRISTDDLLDESLSEEALGEKVVNVALTPVPDGMLETGNGSLYLTALETNSILHFDPKSREVAALIEDPRLQWPDTLALSKEGYLYITASQIHRTPKFNKGENKQQGPFTLYRMKLNPPTEPLPETSPADIPPVLPSGGAALE